MTSVAVVGVGAIGGVVAAALSTCQAVSLTLCARRPVAGLVLCRPDGTSVRCALAAETEPAEAAPVDWVLLATKAYQSEGARPWLNRLVGPATRVAVLQNGVDQVERIGPLVGRAPVISVVVMLAAERDETPSGVVIHQQGPGVLDVADDEHGRSFVSLFEQPEPEAGWLRARTVSDFPTRAWQKLMLNAVCGMAALALQPNAVLGQPGVSEAAISVLEEVATVGRAEGAALPADAATVSLQRILTGAPAHYSSITVDRRQGRPLEWDVRNAVIGRLGRRHGIPTPQNDLLTALLQAADSAGEPAGAAR